MKFSFAALKALKSIKNRISATKFTLPKYFKLRTQLNNPDFSSSEEEEEDLPRRSDTQMRKTPVPVNSPANSELRSQSLNCFNTTDESEMSSIFQSSLVEPPTSHFGQLPQPPSSRPATSMSRGRPMTPAMQRLFAATPFSHQAGRVLCQGTTMKGLPCKNAAVPGGIKCRLH